MNLLSTILDRLNQRIEVGNIFDQIYGLSEPVGEGNDKAWAFYIGNGQAIPVTNFDAKQGTLFWAKRGKITVAKNDSLRLAGCKSIYETRFSMTAYAMVRKSHLPCDSADAQDWVASRVLRLISGTDPQFKTAIGVIAYEVVPNGYQNEIRYLPVNYEWAAVAIDVDVNVSTSSEDGCYDTCATGDIPLPDFEPCTPCLTEVAVDGITIIGNGTPADPLVAVGGGGGTPLRTQDEGTNVSTNTTTLNFTGAGVTASLTSPGIVEVNIPSGGGGGTVTAVTGTAPIASSGGATPDISIPQADTTTDGYLSSADWNTFDGKFDVPTGTSSDYLDGAGTPTPFPAIPPAQVNSDWNAVSGVAEILNKPSIPAAQIQSDWNQANNAALDFIKNKPTIPSTSGLVPYTGATQDVNLGTHTLSAKDLVINHPSGSGVAASITKGGSGEALTVVKSSGSGNAASITGGVTLIDELHLTTDLADAYIASAATWNAKFNTPSGTTADYVRGDGTLATFPTLPVVFKSVTDSTGLTGNTNQIAMSQLIPANTFAAGDIIKVLFRTRKTGTTNFVNLRYYINTTNSLSGATTLALYSVTQFGQMERNLAIKTATNTETFNTTVSTATDNATAINLASSTNIDWTVNQYIIFAIQQATAGDTTIGSMYLIEKL